MANQDLTHRAFVVPANIVGILKQNASTYTATENKQRIQGILANPNVSYEQIKRIKNYFDYADPNSEGYKALGGQEMQNWVNSSLGSQRNSVQNGKKIKTYTSPKNEYLKPHDRDESQVHKQKVSRIPRAGVNAQQIMNNKPVYENTIKRVIKEELTKKHSLYVKDKLKKMLVNPETTKNVKNLYYFKDDKNYTICIVYKTTHSNESLQFQENFALNIISSYAITMKDFEKLIIEVIEEKFNTKIEHIDYL